MKKTRIFAYMKTKVQINCAVTAQLISTFVFATWILQFILFLNLKFQASSHLLWLHKPVCIRPDPESPKPFGVTHVCLEIGGREYGQFDVSPVKYSYSDTQLVHTSPVVLVTNVYPDIVIWY